VTIQQLDLTNERLVLEALAIHCTYPLEWDQTHTQPAVCVPEHLAQLESRHKKAIFYRQDAGRIVAMLWTEIPTRRTAQVRSLWVDPAYRKQGIARALCQAAESWLVEQGVEQLEQVLENVPPGFTAFCQALDVEKVGTLLTRKLALSHSVDTV
jgi:ribosomal protein S18 acetylase RimI-like enzyme